MRKLPPKTTIELESADPLNETELALCDLIVSLVAVLGHPVAEHFVELLEARSKELKAGDQDSATERTVACLTYSRDLLSSVLSLEPGESRPYVRSQKK